MTNLPDRTNWYIEEAEKLGFQPDQALDGYSIWGRGYVALFTVESWLDGGAVRMQLLRARKLGAGYELVVDWSRHMAGCSVDEVRRVLVSLASNVA